MSWSPIRKVDPRLITACRREVRERINAQVREAGVDPHTQVLISDCPTGGTPEREWRAHGATHQYREQLKAAGFKWCKKREFWACYRVNCDKLAGVPCVFNKY